MNQSISSIAPPGLFSAVERRIRWSREVRLLLLVYVVVFVGDGLWRSLLPGYALGALGMDQAQLATLYSLAAVPGLAAIGLGLVARLLPLGAMLAGSCFLAGIALVVASQVTSAKGLLFVALLSGGGVVCFYAVANCLCLVDSEPNETPTVLGRLKGLGPASSLVATLLIVLLLDTVGARTLISGAGLAIIGAGLLVAIPSSDGWLKVQGRCRRARCTISNRWSTYYVLNFLAGARSAIFKAFVIALLFKEYGVSLAGSAALVLVGHVVGALGYVAIGYVLRSVSRRAVLFAIYAIVTAVFIAFFCVAVLRPFSADVTVIVLEMLFLIDSLLLGASVATDSYLKTHTRDDETVGVLTTGLSLYYVAGVVVPILGGWLWQGFGYGAVFALGGVVTASAAVLALRLDDR